MNITQVLTISDNAFTKQLSAWAQNMSIEVIHCDIKNENSIDAVDGVIIFHENHNIDKNFSELLSQFDLKGKPVGKIDINGTLTAAISNISLWREKNKCKRILFLGNESMTTNPNLERFVAQLENI